MELGNRDGMRVIDCDDRSRWVVGGDLCACLKSRNRENREWKLRPCLPWSSGAGRNEERQAPALSMVSAWQSGMVFYFAFFRLALLRGFSSGNSPPTFFFAGSILSKSFSSGPPPNCFQ